MHLSFLHVCPLLCLIQFFPAFFFRVSCDSSFSGKLSLLLQEFLSVGPLPPLVGCFWMGFHDSSHQVYVVIYFSLLREAVSPWRAGKVASNPYNGPQHIVGAQSMFVE